MPSSCSQLPHSNSTHVRPALPARLPLPPSARCSLLIVSACPFSEWSTFASEHQPACKQRSKLSLARRGMGNLPQQVGQPLSAAVPAWPRCSTGAARCCLLLAQHGFGATMRAFTAALVCCLALAAAGRASGEPACSQPLRVPLRSSWLSCAQQIGLIVADGRREVHNAAQSLGVREGPCSFPLMLGSDPTQRHG